MRDSKTSWENLIEIAEHIKAAFLVIVEIIMVILGFFLAFLLLPFVWPIVLLSIIIGVITYVFSKPKKGIIKW